MAKFDKVSDERKAKIFAYNRQRAADSSAAADMHRIAEEIERLPKGQLKKVLSDEVVEILSRYGVEV